MVFIGPILFSLPSARVMPTGSLKVCICIIQSYIQTFLAMASFSGASRRGFSKTGGPRVSMKCRVWCPQLEVADCAVMMLGNCATMSVNFCSELYALIEHIELCDSIHKEDKLVTLSNNLLLRMSTIRLKLCRKSAPIIALAIGALMNCHLNVRLNFKSTDSNVLP